MRSSRAALVFAGTWGLLVVAGRARLLRDPGTFWHTLVGERILSAGLPATDWLSFTFAGRPWVAHQWLGECLMAALHRLGGLDAMVVATAAALAFLFAWLFERLVARGVAWLWAVLVVALALLAASQHLLVRPHLVSVFLFATTYSRLADVDAGRARLGSLAPLPLLFLVWVNVHGGAVGGLATLGLFVAAWTAESLTGRWSPIRNGRDLAALHSLALACVATVPITPYGLGTARAWFAILASPELARNVVEHASVLRAGGWQVLALGALYVAVCAGAPRKSVRAASAIPLVWLVLTLEHVRHAPLFAVAATLAIADLLPAVRWAPALARRGLHLLGAPDDAPRRGIAPAAGAVIAVAIVAIAIHHHAFPDRSPAIARLDPAWWPVDILPALRAEERDLAPGAPILNDVRFGGFLAYHAPRLRVFVDDRWELYGDAFMREEIRADAGWLEGWVEREDVQAALAERGSRLERYLEASGRWTRLASSPAASLYRRSATSAAVDRGWEKQGVTRGIETAEERK